VAGIFEFARPIAASGALFWAERRCDRGRDDRGFGGFAGLEAARGRGWQVGRAVGLAEGEETLEPT
jgi:hypothetical protein